MDLPPETKEPALGGLLGVRLAADVMNRSTDTERAACWAALSPEITLYF
jgi:hypothetical protein